MFYLVSPVLVGLQENDVVYYKNNLNNPESRPLSWLYKLLVI